MFWNSQSDEPSDVAQQPREKLPAQLQTLVDRDDSFYDDIYTPYSVDSTETPYRYAGYANRLRTVLLSAHRYVAYTSDIGESFRPVAHPYLVRTAYGISWTYLIGDVIHEGYKAYLRNRRVLAPLGEAYKDAKDLTQDKVAIGMATGNIGGSLSSPVSSSTTNENFAPWPATQIPLIEDYRMVMGKRAVFQSLASMGLPALTIHSVVKYSGRMLKNTKNVFFRTWAPIGLGLSIVPFLPYIFDEPVEEAVEWAFRTGLYLYAGEDAIRPLPHTAHPTNEDSTSLSTLLQVQRASASTPNNSSATLSWEEYKEQRRLAKEDRMRAREQRGGSGSGPLAALFESFSSKEEKKPKSE